jgi:hypothetical protein
LSLHPDAKVASVLTLNTLELNVRAFIPSPADEQSVELEESSSYVKLPLLFFKIVHFQENFETIFQTKKVIRPCWYWNLDQIKNRVVSQRQMKWF